MFPLRSFQPNRENSCYTGSSSGTSKSVALFCHLENYQPHSCPVGSLEKWLSGISPLAVSLCCLVNLTLITVFLWLLYQRLDQYIHFPDIGSCLIDMAINWVLGVYSTSWLHSTRKQHIFWARKYGRWGLDHFCHFIEMTGYRYWLVSLDHISTPPLILFDILPYYY